MSHRFLLINLIILILFSTFQSCNNVDSRVNNYICQNVIENKNAYYFSLDSVYFFTDIKNASGDSAIKAMYSDILFNLKEPILFNNNNVESIRLLWVRSFNPPLSIHIKKENVDRVVVCTKKLISVFKNDTLSKYDIIDSAFTIDIQQWDELLKEMETNRFWKSPSHKDQPISTKDGINFIYECKLKNKYNVIYESVPDVVNVEQDYVKKILNRLKLN